jgi:hypothetical protein
MVNLNRNIKGKGFFQFCDFENFGKFSKKKLAIFTRKKIPMFSFLVGVGEEKAMV